MERGVLFTKKRQDRNEQVLTNANKEPWRNKIIINKSSTTRPDFKFPTSLKLNF